MQLNGGSRHFNCGTLIERIVRAAACTQVGLVGGNMANAMSALGVCGCISDGYLPLPRT